ncbi:MAG: circadian clock protein KaiC [Methanosaeta sp. PtaB.Bin039]|nr:MAG: circadian clock protein KaiC [Methanosaeta sp. PtaB.Bin039]HOT05962.1 gas vesicle protein GvpD [Methanotrichaceae archaeon]HQF16834.1 gas vesicle protein GvpD [Methanotrichaceae archaeon]HQI90160.1 gas vesicle protein GvpD [Methanotrichaceae archaeon]HQJ29118.1 gas vesicle protein GvpD [Methanotrichaceae archaeon]
MPGISHPRNIPQEIKDFFAAGEGQTLLIKGLPGTGKTTLAFEILKTLCHRQNGLYISTRVDPNQLYRAYPWITDIIPPKNVINATQAKLMRSLQGLTGGIATSYESVLDFFRIFFDEAEDMDNPMIVIDSWDAIMNYTAPIIGGSQQSFEQNICEFARDLGIHLIFVAETSNLTPMDYIVDGVVCMEQFHLAGGTDHQDSWSSGMRSRFARAVRLDKLRGVEIGQRIYTASLHGGRFQYFDPNREKSDASLSADAPRIPDPGDDRISTGLPDLDQLCGGFQYASCNVLEIGHGVGKRYYHMLTTLASNAIKNGRGVCILPSIGFELSPRDIFVPSNVSFVQPQGDLSDWGQRLIQTWEDLRDRTGRPILNIIGMDAMEFAFGYPALLNFASQMIRKWKETNDINLMVVKTGQESINMAVHAADTYFVVNEINGGLCLYGVIPRTEPHHIILAGQNQVRLTPII